MPQVVREAGDLDDIGRAAERTAELAADLGHPRLCVSRLRTKSSLPGPSTWVLAESRRRAAEWMSRPRSRAKSSRSARLCTGSSETHRSRSLLSLTLASLRRPGRTQLAEHTLRLERHRG